jgi:hypothetical protein
MEISICLFFVLEMTNNGKKNESDAWPVHSVLAALKLKFNNTFVTLFMPVIWSYFVNSPFLFECMSICVNLHGNN